MKQIKVITVFLLLLSGSGWAQSQDSLMRYYRKYPQKALAEATRLHQEALREQNTALLIRSLLLKTAYTVEINPEQYPEMIREAETMADREKDTTARCILYSYIGQLYFQFYRQDQYIYDQRASLQDSVPADLNAWSGNLFRDKINHYFQTSLTPASLLEQTPVKRYEQILLLAPETDSLRPTLYDFLCHRAINMLSYMAPTVRNCEEAFLPGALSSLPEFLQPDLPASGGIIPEILNLYQRLLQFRQNAGDPAALLLANLERIDYAYRLYSFCPQADSLYIRALDRLAADYASQPLIVEVWYKQASLLANLPDQANLRPLLFPGQTYSDGKALQQALALCEKGIRAYPHYPRINLLHQLIKQIKTPSLNATYPNHTYAGQGIRIETSYRNLNEITLEVRRISMNTATYEKNRWKKKTSGEVVFRQCYTLSPTLSQHDTVFQLPGFQPGLYQVSIHTPRAKKNLPGYFVCSNLFTTQQVNNQKLVFQVRDVISGRPVKDASIYLYKRDYRNPYEVMDTLTTDKDGMATTTHQSGNYQVVNSANPNGLVCESAFFSGRRSDTYTNTWLITDRKLYRPGQTIYFKGIAWKATTDTLYPLTHRSYTVRLNDNRGKNLSSQTLRTDKFGSFSGSFRIPAQTLNGNYSIVTSEGYTAVTVAEYKRPEFEVTLKSTKPSYHAGDSILVEGRVNSFSGVPVPEATVSYEIKAYSPYLWFPSVVSTRQGTVSTDAGGEFRLRFAAIPPVTNVPLTGFYYYRITATTTDAKGETQSNTTEIPVFTGKYKPTLTLPEQIDKNRPTAFHISLERFPETEKTASPADYSIALLKSPATPLLNLVLQDTLIEKVVQQGQLSLSGTDSICPDLRSYPSGAYLFTLRYEGITTRKVFYLYDPTDKTPPIPTYNWLVKEKTKCKPGESARLLFGTSLKNACVFYEVYNGSQLLTRKQLLLSDEVVPIEIPYKKEYGRQLWFSLNYVRNGNYIQNLVPVTREEENRELTIQTKVFRDKLAPGQQEEWDLRIVDARGTGVDAEVLALMYDASLDRIVPYSIPEFFPQYLDLPFYYSWYPGWKREEKNYATVYNWLTDTLKYPVPPFVFTRLNTYTFKAPLSPYSLMYGFTADASDYGTEVCAEAEVKLNAVHAPTAKSVRRVTGSIRQNDFTAGAGNESTASSVHFRQNFQETAFFYPQLRTDSNGYVHLKFTVPEATTRWKFYAMASTRRLFTGYTERYITTSKELMVRPNLPRFLRNGDQAEIKVTVSNLAEKPQQGNAVLELFIPSTDSVFIHRQTGFEIPAGESRTLSFRFDVPQGIDLAGCRISASTPVFSDGEQQLIPVLPDEMLLTQTQPIYASTPGTHTFRLPPPPATRQDYRLTFELASNPVWYAVLALPTLTEPRYENVTDLAASFYANTLAARIVRANPEIGKALRIWTQQKDQTTLLSRLEQNTELKSILLESSPWVLEAQNETERMQTLARLFDHNRLQYLQRTALQKLRELQTPSGGWSWFKGMYASHFMTCNVLTILARANTHGETEYEASTKEMQIRALRYLDESIRSDYKHKSEQLSYNQLLYLYTRSQYRDIPLGDALEAHRYYLNLMKKQWDRFSLYEKALAAMTLHRYGITDIPAEILESLRQYAVRNEQEGMYWPGNRNSGYRNSAVQTQVAILEAFAGIQGNTPAINAMKQWLLLQKQTQAWASVPATVDAIYALLLTGSDLLAHPEHPQIKLGNQPLQLSAGNDPLGYLKKTYPAGQFNETMFTAEITKQTDAPSWGGLYLQYFQKLSEIQPSQSGLTVSKQLWVEQEGKNGKTLLPLAKQVLKTGDKVIVRLTFSLDRDMEFLVLKDLRAACFEPIGQVSGLRWKFGSVYYEDIRDAGTNFFFNALSKGTYVIEYGVRVNQEGEYQDGIATFQSMYAPEFNAFSDSRKVKIGKGL